MQVRISGLAGLFTVVTADPNFLVLQGAALQPTYVIDVNSSALDKKVFTPIVLTVCGDDADHDGGTRIGGDRITVCNLSPDADEPCRGEDGTEAIAGPEFAARRVRRHVAGCGLVLGRAVQREGPGVRAQAVRSVLEDPRVAERGRRVADAGRRPVRLRRQRHHRRQRPVLVDHLHDWRRLRAARRSASRPTAARATTSSSAARPATTSPAARATTRSSACGAPTTSTATAASTSTSSPAACGSRSSTTARPRRSTRGRSPTSSSRVTTRRSSPATTRSRRLRRSTGTTWKPATTTSTARARPRTRSVAPSSPSARPTTPIGTTATRATSSRAPTTTSSSATTASSSSRSPTPTSPTCGSRRSRRRRSPRSVPSSPAAYQNGGDDTINGDEGRDLLIGGAGHDLADGDAQDDMVFGDNIFLLRRVIGEVDLPDDDRLRRGHRHHQRPLPDALRRPHVQPHRPAQRLWPERHRRQQRPAPGRRHRPQLSRPRQPGHRHRSVVGRVPRVLRSRPHRRRRVPHLRRQCRHQGCEQLGQRLPRRWRPQRPGLRPDGRRRGHGRRRHRAGRSRGVPRRWIAQPGRLSVDRPRWRQLHPRRHLRPRR